MKAKNEKPIVRVSRKHIEQIIEATNGAFYSVTFTKKPKPGFAVGETRKMVTRNNVHKDVKGTGAPLPAGSPLRRRFDVQVNGWRSINLETTSEIRAGGKIYKVED